MRGHPWLAAAYDPLTRRAEKRLLAPIRRRLLGNLSGRVLDLGTGTGANLPHLGSASLVVALDADPSMLRRAVPKARAAGSRVAFVFGTAEALPFKPETFDAVVSALVLCAVDPLDRSLTEIQRVLRPGGRLHFLEHVRATDWRGPLQDAIEPLWMRVVGCHPNRRTADALSAAGFVLDYLDESDPGPTPLITGVARQGNGTLSAR